MTARCPAGHERLLRLDCHDSRGRMLLSVIKCLACPYTQVIRAKATADHRRPPPLPPPPRAGRRQ